MRSYGEYVECSCGSWARIVRAEDRQHRDRIVCAKCGRVTIADNIPLGRRIELVGDSDDDYTSIKDEKNKKTLY